MKSASTDGVAMVVTIKLTFEAFAYVKNFVKATFNEQVASVNRAPAATADQNHRCCAVTRIHCAAEH